MLKEKRSLSVLNAAVLVLAAALILSFAFTFSARAQGSASQESESSQQRSGWYGNSYYQAGTRVSGWQDIGGKRYYFTAAGYMTGLMQVEGSYYYFDTQGVMLTGWRDIGGSKHFFLDSGKAAYGSLKISGKYYVFDIRGTLMTGNGKRIISVGDGYKYYVSKSGRAVSGWIYVSSVRKVICAGTDGRLAVNTTIDGIRINGNGYCSITNQGIARIEARKFIKKHTKASWSRTKKFKVCWRYIVAYNNYVAIDRSSKYFKKNWVYRVAVDMFTSDLTGDCNGIACAAAAVAKELGFEPYVIRTENHHCFVIAKGRYYDNMHGAKFAAKKHGSYKVKEKIRF